MTSVITAPGIGVTDASFVEVGPVDRIHPAAAPPSLPASGSMEDGGASGHAGQVWRYHPGSNVLRLVYTSRDAAVLEMPDNLTVLPWGDVVLCEDGGGTDSLRLLTADGRIVDLARNAATESEFAGACFVEPQTLFVNIQGDGLTLAIWGPWRTQR